MLKLIAAAVITFALAAPALAQSKPVSAKRTAQIERMHQCGTEWKTAKADAAVKAAGWPHFWSECNTRLKAAAAQ